MPSPHFTLHTCPQPVLRIVVFGVELEHVVRRRRVLVRVFVLVDEILQLEGKGVELGRIPVAVYGDRHGRHRSWQSRPAAARLSPRPPGGLETGDDERSTLGSTFPSAGRRAQFVGVLIRGSWGVPFRGCV